MKSKLTLIITCLFFLGHTSSNAQFFKKLKERAKQAAEETVSRKTEEKTSEALDSLIEKPFKKKKKRRSQNGEEDLYEESNEDYTDEGYEEDTSNNTQPQLWSQYNFVPGDKIIFNDDLSIEENGEFPSRWDLLSGNAENASYGENLVINLSHKAKITPLMDKTEYLPEVFTIEFDAFFQRTKGPGYQDYFIKLWSDGGKYGYSNDRKSYCSAIVVNMHGASLNCNRNGSSNEYETFEDSMVVGVDEPVWRRVALAFNKRSLKLFLDEKRVLNIPNLGYQPEALVLEVFAVYKEFSAIKNIRIAEGGKKLYDRVVAEGKFVTRGILFDVNSSNIKPESGGVLKEVVAMMLDHPNLNFRIEGHTDSDGDAEYNLSLSAERAEAVKWALVEQGIAENRFETNGKGEAVPAAENTTPEGKANNRRVEFIKL
ncbi:OmpA family protein [Flagellimonas eckloniae]|uniref:OmpA family protein n=1 Tax=Flagellimonas eckloniae TaxID=346185 RepID=UPI0006DD1A15|nr:OmpA family protein [Allomuricauda eckloniae]